MLTIDDKNDVIMATGNNKSHGRNLCPVCEGLITQSVRLTRYAGDARYIVRQQKTAML